MKIIPFPHNSDNNYLHRMWLIMLLTVFCYHTPILPLSCWKHMKAALWAVTLLAHLLFSLQSNAATTSLPNFKVDKNQTSVSGLSLGGLLTTVASIIPKRQCLNACLLKQTPVTRFHVPDARSIFSYSAVRRELPGACHVQDCLRIPLRWLLV